MNECSRAEEGTHQSSMNSSAVGGLRFNSNQRRQFVEITDPPVFSLEGKNFICADYDPEFILGDSPLTAIFKQVRSWDATRNDSVTWWEGWW
ncbi:hypothetical protein CDAR_117161 [Caerostris darwini]|uniref:Uncharacterized protein n=1 Tax=Caerostris darwini TaxID=1538125 RepID=A0AAV4U5C2_9ARAC|nr:hypothetical protein CDAR_117161 [Caerostris darwini]